TFSNSEIQSEARQSNRERCGTSQGCELREELPEPVGDFSGWAKLNGVLELLQKADGQERKKHRRHQCQVSVRENLFSHASMQIGPLAGQRILHRFLQNKAGAPDN